MPLLVGEEDLKATPVWLLVTGRLPSPPSFFVTALRRLPGAAVNSQIEVFYR